MDLHSRILGNLRGAHCPAGKMSQHLVMLQILFQDDGTHQRNTEPDDLEKPEVGTVDPR